MESLEIANNNNNNQINLSQEITSPEFANQNKRLRELQQETPRIKKTPRLSNTPRLSHFESSNRVSILQLLDRRLEEHILQIKLLWEERENKLLNEIEILKREVTSANERIDQIETAAVENIDLKSQIQELKLQTMRQENLFVACDLRINNVPFTKDENVYNIFDDICRAIDIQTPSVKAIYRLSNKNNKEKTNSTDAAIIVNLFSPYDKNFVLKSIAAFKKHAGYKNLLLNLIGFSSNEAFYVNESLTLKNHRILLEAVKLKRDKRLHSAYTFRGLVYIKRLITDQPTRIDYFEQLNEFFLSSNDCPEVPATNVVL